MAYGNGAEADDDALERWRCAEKRLTALEGELGKRLAKLHSSYAAAPHADYVLRQEVEREAHRVQTYIDATTRLKGMSSMHLTRLWLRAGLTTPRLATDKDANAPGDAIFVRRRSRRWAALCTQHQQRSQGTRVACPSAAVI